MGADQRRREIREGILARGFHPATHLPLSNIEDQACGNCEHAVKYQHNSRGYWKCDLVPVTRGPGTDIRLKWPGCTRWEPVQFVRPIRRPPPKVSTGQSIGSVQYHAQ